MSLVEFTGLKGRDNELITIASSLSANKHTLIVGQAGYGKSTLLNYTRLLAEDLRYPHAIIGAGTAREALKDFARQCHEAFGLTITKKFFDELPPQTKTRFEREGKLEWVDLNRPLGRLTIQGLKDILVFSFEHAPLGAKKFVIFIESLKCPPTQAAIYQEFFHYAQIISTINVADQYRAHLQPLVQNFQVTVELKPLAIEYCREIANAWLQYHPEVVFESEKVRETYIRHIAHDSNGVPIAIEHMLESAKNEEIITRSSVKQFEHEAGVKYVSMLPFLVIVSAIFMAMKYIGRGLGNAEMVIFGSIGGVVFFLLLFFGRKLEAKK
jgi:hypothetical protein